MDAKRAQWWLKHVKRQASSGMSREAYCAWYGLSRSTLYRWERRLRVSRTALEAMAWIEVVPPDRSHARC